jgi:6-phosphogluconolactonase (cycloisomerase 2 family)
MRRKPGRIALAAISILCSLILAACNCAPTLRYVSVAPTSATIFAAATTSGTTTTITACTTQQFAATGYYSNGTQTAISSTAGWGSSNTSAATINAAGLASVASTVPAAGGTSVITASSGGASATANLAVDILTSITVTPAAVTVPLDGSQQYAATGTFNAPGSSTPTTADITSQVSWSVTGGTTSSDGKTNSNGHASIGTATGLLTTTSQDLLGITGVIATICSVSGRTTVIIGAPTAQVLQITPDSPSIAVGQTVDLSAQLINKDGSTTYPVPTAVTWTSATTTVASVVGNPASPYDGLVTGLTAGTSVITATIGTGTAALTATTTVTVSAAVARFAYVGNEMDSSISAYAVNYSTGSTPAPNGALTPVGKFSVPNGVQQVVVHPSGKYIYAIGTDANSTITQFTVNPTTGTLTNTTNLTHAASTTQASYAVLDPSGIFLYVGNNLDNSIVVFSITQSNGQLSSAPIQTKTVNVSAPTQLFYSVAGPYLYSLNVGNHTVSGYTISTSGSTAGQITEITTAGGVFDLATNDSSFASAHYGAIAATGMYIYVPDGSSNVEGIGVGTGGVLSKLTGSPFPVAGSSSTIDAIVDPKTKYLYVADITKSEVFTLPLTSGVPGVVSGSPTSVLDRIGMAEDTSGAILLVANNQSNILSSFAVGSGGALPSSRSATATATSPQFPVFYNGTAAAIIAPTEVVAANPGSGNVAAFTSGAGGVLTEDPTTSNYPTFSGDNFVATSSLSDLIVTGGNLTNQVASFIATPANAGTSPTLTATPGSPATIATASARPTAIVIDATGKYIVAANTNNGGLYGFSYNGTNVTPIPGFAPLPLVASVISIAINPQGTLIYALANGFIRPVTFTAGTATPQTILITPNFVGNWTAAAIDSSGQYLEAYDATGKAISTFSICQNSVAPCTFPGDLIFLHKDPVTGNPYSFAFDPQDRYLVVSDNVSNTVTAYSYTPTSTTAVFAPLTGSAVITLPTAPGGSPGQVAIDASGQYLYFTLSGTSTTAGAVAVYTTNVAAGVPAFAAVTGSPFTTGDTTTSSTTGGLGTQGVGVIDIVQ